MKHPSTAVTIVALLGLVLWLGIALVRVENERYALQLGICSIDSAHPLAHFDCLQKVQTRTGWWWHLFYALKD